MENFKLTLNSLKAKSAFILKSLGKSKLVITLILLTLIFSSTLIAYNLFFAGKIFPGVSVSGVEVGGLTVSEAEGKLKEKIRVPQKIVLAADNQKFEIDLQSLNFSYDYQKSAEDAFLLYRSGTKPVELAGSLLSLQKKPQVPLKYTLNEGRLTEALGIFAGQIAQDPLYPEATLSQSGVVVDKGREGRDINLQKLERDILNNFESARFSEIAIPVTPIDPTITDEEAAALKTRAEKFVGKSVTLTFEFQTFTFADKDLIPLLAKNNYYTEKVTALVAKISQGVNRDAQNAVFKFEEGRIQEFIPAKDGITVEKEKLSEKIISELENLEKSENLGASIDVPTINTPPKVTTKEVNDLGIKELIGRGDSKFAGSIPSRVHNVSLASSRFNGVLIPPGETFSFNNALGDVSSLTGYKQAYIIKDGKTVLGDGGGVCQVSTTFFRAALNAGLPIVERRAHSYRVSYYEQGAPPGIDATVYAPTTDLKILNDTPGHILVQTQVDTKQMTLVFEFYGTSDGRAATLTKPVMTGVVPPPEDLYMDDPTLPSGQIKQIDWKAWGAKVSFNYKVERSGEVVYEKTFLSNYRPWQAKFLRGTGPVN